MAGKRDNFGAFENPDFIIEQNSIQFPQKSWLTKRPSPHKVAIIGIKTGALAIFWTEVMGASELIVFDAFTPHSSECDESKRQQGLRKRIWQHNMTSLRHRNPQLYLQFVQKTSYQDMPLYLQQSCSTNTFDVVVLHGEKSKAHMLLDLHNALYMLNLGGYIVVQDFNHPLVKSATVNFIEGYLPFFHIMWMGHSCWIQITKHPLGPRLTIEEEMQALCEHIAQNMDEEKDESPQSPQSPQSNHSARSAQSAPLPRSPPSSPAMDDEEEEEDSMEYEEI